jgi:hypothetical protein
MLRWILKKFRPTPTSATAVSLLALIVVGGGLLLLAVLMPAIAQAAPVTGTCSPTKVKYIASALDNSARTAQTFGNLPEASVIFAQGGAVASCVIVRFSALVYLGYDGVVVRAVMDSATLGLPASVELSTQDTTNVNTQRAESFDFIFPSVAPGVHSVRMQFRSPGGSIAYVFRHNTIVEYAP